MGSSVNAKCACGFEAKDIGIGGARSNFLVYCTFPVYCRSCQKMSSANLLAGVTDSANSPAEIAEINPVPKPQQKFLNRLSEMVLPYFRQKPAENDKADETPKCRNCGSEEIVPYDSTLLVMEKGRQVASWNVEEQLGRVLILTDGKYFCPECKDFELVFESGGLCWD